MRDEPDVYKSCIMTMGVTMLGMDLAQHDQPTYLHNVIYLVDHSFFFILQRDTRTSVAGVIVGGNYFGNASKLEPAE